MLNSKSFYVCPREVPGEAADDDADDDDTADDVENSVVEIQELQEAPVQLVEVEDGQEDAKEVDQDPDGIQHIVTIRSLCKKIQ